MSEADHGPVLVVDDHELSRRLIEHVLAATGLEVLSAGSIHSARRVLAGLTPAGIVLDLELPDGSGLDLARSCRRDPGLEGCAILVCTATGGRDAERRARCAGCDAYVTKPIDVQRFASLMHRLLAHRRRSAQMLGQPLSLAGSAPAPDAPDDACR